MEPGEHPIDCQQCHHHFDSESPCFSMAQDEGIVSIS